MTDVSFDFDQEAKRAFQDFPQLRKETGFIDFSDPSLTILRAGRNLKATEGVKRKLKKSGSCVTEAMGHVPGEKIKLVAFFPEKRLAALSEKRDKYFTLDHEIGHCLIDGTDPIFRENAADAFAAIRNLQRFGNPEDLAIVSATRSLNLMKWGDLKHLSSPLLNQIIKDSEHTDFASLSPEETIQKAREYAEQFAPPQKDLDTFNGMRINSLSWLLPKKLSIKYHSWKAFRRHSPLATEVGASLIRPFLSPEGADFMGKHMKFSPREREKLQKRYQKSLARSG